MGVRMGSRVWVSVGLAGAGCAATNATDPVPALTRASMTLRGLRPSPEEIALVQADPDNLGALARGWLTEPAFGDTIRDMHAEQLLLRWDARGHLSPIGPLTAFSQAEITSSTDEEPLRLVERIVTTGRPYTDIVTSPVAMTDPVVERAYGAAWDETPGLPRWQESTWDDGRPAAGILASTGLWQRHMSSITNHHRGRANLIRSTLLCDPLPGGSVVSDPTVPVPLDDDVCGSCHRVLDPLASALYGLGNGIVPADNMSAELAGCPPMLAPNCMPLRTWEPARLQLRELDAMPAPALDGVPVDGLAGLGQAIARDPRFATCTARRFVAYFEQVSVDEVDDDRADSLAQVLVDADWDARALALAIALDPSFAPDAGRVGALQVRPEQLSRTLAASTGFVWTSDIPDYGPVDLLTTDFHGYRLMMGGIDGWEAVKPVYAATATRELAWMRAAERAAAAAVDTGTLPVGGLVTDRDDVKRALGDLYLRLLGEPGADVQPALTLWEGAFSRSNDAAEAWRVTIAALLRDPRAVTY